MSQYNLSFQTSQNIIKEQKLDILQVKEGVTISGTAVKQATGNEISKLDLASGQNTEQRQFDQLVFGLDYSKNINMTNNIL